jgi:8-oxo-dGTP pyrophosphatase MutT (NUDIX family)
VISDVAPERALDVAREAEATIALALLRVGDAIVMQLRDEIPGIANPGTWGFFGGRCEPGEDPSSALRRELVEELGLELEPGRLAAAVLDDHNEFFEAPVCALAFEVDATEKWPAHEVREGQEARLVSPGEALELSPKGPIASRLLAACFAGI